MSKPQKKVRFAESERRSSCAFADKIAEISISEFKKRTPENIRALYKQTVLASFILENRSKETLELVAFGVGTKFLAGSFFHDPTDQCQKLQLLRRVRDCHAEVLARRALLRYLYSQLFVILESEKANNQVSDCIFYRDIETGKFKLGTNFYFHFYTSSQPCGNASIKKWAKGKHTGVYEGISDNTPPKPLEHEKLQITAREDGQVALLVKRSVLSCSSQKIPGLDQVPSSLPSSENTTYESNSLKFVISKIQYPPGTAPVDSKQGFLMTCSDKIARWNALGVQGTFLMSFLLDPIYINTITVGRKFGKRFCERALCCRIQDFKFNSRYYVHHPNMLGTGVKFDETSIDLNDNSGASFDTELCLYWSYGDDQVGLISSRTGFDVNLFDETSLSDQVFSSQSTKDLGSKVSQLASCLFLQKFMSVTYAMRNLENFKADLDFDKNLTDCANYKIFKRNQTEHCAAKYHLLSEKNLFRGWIKKL